jgi:cytochrome c peroxidase
MSARGLGWVALLAAALSLTAACAQEAPSNTRELIDLRVPRSFPRMIVPEDNPTTRQGVALGRQLYYDRRLDPRGARACADCHLQNRGFSNPMVRGVIPHVNLAWSYYFLWDGHFEGGLEEAMRMEVEIFFGTDVNRLREPDLEEMFLAAFGTREITTRRAAYALAQFQRTMISQDSRFDRYVDGDAAAINESERRGMQIFYSERGECFHCHATRLFTDNRFHNIGLDRQVAGTGRGAITHDPQDDGRFKTPTLRNVDRTGPYMHDDRFATLEQVVDFLQRGPRVLRHHRLADAQRPRRRDAPRPAGAGRPRGLSPHAHRRDLPEQPRPRASEAVGRFPLGSGPPTSSVTASPGAKRRGETAHVGNPRLRSSRALRPKRRGLTTWAVSPLRFAPGEAVTGDVGGLVPSSSENRSNRGARCRATKLHGALSPRPSARTSARVFAKV